MTIKSRNDGKKVVFSRYQEGIWHDIYLINTDGTEERQLTQTTNDETPATLNYDGSQVFFCI